MKNIYQNVQKLREKIKEKKISNIQIKLTLFPFEVFPGTDKIELQS